MCRNSRACFQQILRRPSEERDGYFCTTDLDGPLEVLWTEDNGTGRITNIEDLFADEVSAFHGVHHALDADLRTRIEALGDSDLVDVTVWFAIDESDLANQDEIIASEVVGTQVRGLLAQRMREGAFQLAADISGLSSANPELPRPTIVSRLEPTVQLGAPRLDLRVPRGLLESIGDLEQVTWIGETPDEYIPSTGEAYFWTDTDNVLQTAGWDGSSQKVAIVEKGYPDSFINLLGAAAQSGSDSLDDCADFWGTIKKCHCDLGTAGFHPRAVGGVVRSSNLSGGTSFIGTAKAAVTLFANFEIDPPHSTNCIRSGQPDSTTSAINWAVSQGAHVLNFSYSDGQAVGSPQDAGDRFWDYVASHSPYPLIVATTGNDNCPTQSANRLYNGIVVGGSNHAGTAGDRAAEDMYCDFWNGTAFKGTQGTNYISGPGPSSSGWELPHVVAPAIDVSTAGAWDTPDSQTGTSFAAPQISGIAASIFELNSAVRPEPAVVLAGFLVGANEDVDEDRGGVWPMKFSDSVDDLDGAGLVNAFLTGVVLDPSSQKNNGNTASTYGHDYGSISSGSTPAFSYYSEVWNANVASQATLRVAAVLQSSAVCGSPASWTNCSLNGFPLYYLEIWEGSTLRAFSYNTWQNYQFAPYKNTTASPKNYAIKIYVTSWMGLSSTRFGVAWAS